MTPTQVGGVLHRLRWSMAVQIGVSITVLSIVLIAVGGYALQRVFVDQLHDDNVALLLSNVIAIRDELEIVGADPATIVGQVERRVPRMKAALLDETGRVVAASSSFPVEAVPRAAEAVDLDAWPHAPTLDRLEALRKAQPAATHEFDFPDGRSVRTLLGRIGTTHGPTAIRAVVATIEPTPTMRLKTRGRESFAAALVAGPIAAVLLCIWIAGRIVAGAKRLGSAAGRIGAEALSERLPLDHTPTELVESTIAFNRMLDRLESSFETLSAFSSDLAHELRTPINNLLGEAQVALSRPRSADEYRAVLESSVEEYERMSRMIGNMLFLARADNIETVIAPHWVDVALVVGRVTSYFELIAEERNVRLTTNLHDAWETSHRVYADEDLMVRALSNLVSNAVRHATRGSAVEISSSAGPAGEHLIDVSNRGEPIPVEMQARIFERFMRIDDARGNSSASSGLGLSIVRSIMSLHHGQVTVQSVPGQPTVFRLRFSLTDSGPRNANG